MTPDEYDWLKPGDLVQTPIPKACIVRPGTSKNGKIYFELTDRYRNLSSNILPVCISKANLNDVILLYDNDLIIVNRIFLNLPDCKTTKTS